MQGDIAEKIKSVIGARQKVVAGVVKDEFGVPIPFLPTDISMENERIKFSIPKTNPAFSLIARFPETSLSLVDIESIWKWDNPTGFQVKGIAEQSGDSFSLEVFEIYDVIPKAGLDLNIPIFRKKLMWAKSRFSKSYKFPQRSLPVSKTSLDEVKGFIERVQDKGYAAYVCTIDPLNGIPNISGRWICAVEPTFLLYGDSKRHKTQINAEKPSPVSVMTFDPITGTGYVLCGWNSISNDPNHKKKIEEYWKMKGFNIPSIRDNMFHPEEIYRFSRITYTKVFEARPRNEWILG